MEMSRERVVEAYRRFGPRVRENVGQHIVIGVSRSALLYRVGINGSAMLEWAREYPSLSFYLCRIGSDGNLEDEIQHIDRSI
tara:strand:- start:2142 stop:2387 length:246 start_codon:yes stop_codon:yes gene_type:complete